MLIIIILLLINYKINASYNENGLAKTEERLMNKIFNNYDKSFRPSDTVEIKFSLYLNQIVTLIEQEELIVLNVFLDHEWLDSKSKYIYTNYLIIYIYNYYSI